MELFRTVISVTALALAGCAATPKPVMPDASYAVYAARWAGFKKCGQAGLMSPEIASQGMQYVQGDASAFNVDADRLQALSLAYLNDASAPTPANCNDGAMAVVARKRQINQHNSMVAQDQKAWADMINSNKPVRANCHQIGSQTVCDSY